MARPPQLSLAARSSNSRPHTGFSLTELLVVIGIIALLVGILLVALGKVQSRARQTQTESTMQQFLNACTAFQAENDRYPGVIPEVVLDANPQISSTENALLDLLGGCRVLAPTDDTTPDSAAETDFNNFDAAIPAVSKVGPLIWNTPSGDWKLVIDLTQIGKGPIVNGKPRAPYFTPGASELVKLASPGNQLPDLVDAWGQPILYLRQLRERGPLVQAATNAPAPQFLVGAISPYVNAVKLGELQVDQIQSLDNPNRWSILNFNTSATELVNFANLARMLEHPAITGQSRGSICLISAGPDGVYFSRADGPGSGSVQIDDLTTQNPKVVDDYDDIRVFGGA